MGCECRNEVSTTLVELSMAIPPSPHIEPQCDPVVQCHNSEQRESPPGEQEVEKMWVLQFVTMFKGPEELMVPAVNLADLLRVPICGSWHHGSHLCRVELDFKSQDGGEMRGCLLSARCCWEEDKFQYPAAQWDNCGWQQLIIYF